MLQLGTSIVSLELPVHTLLTVVSLGMPRRKFLVEFFDTVYAPFQLYKGRAAETDK